MSLPVRTLGAAPVITPDHSGQWFSALSFLGPHSPVTVCSLNMEAPYGPGSCGPCLGLSGAGSPTQHPVQHPARCKRSANKSLWSSKRLASLLSSRTLGHPAENAFPETGVKLRPKAGTRVLTQEPTLKTLTLGGCPLGEQRHLEKEDRVMGNAGDTPKDVPEPFHPSERGFPK